MTVSPVRPRFYRGQLLTDEDLQQLVTWTDRRLALVRHRDGWGVAQGLEVCADPDRPAGVRVSSGYALSCRGEDIVLCEEEFLDLSEHCTDTGPDCTDPAAPKPPRDKPIAVDITVSFAQVETDPVRPLVREDCGRAPECEATRIRETARLGTARRGDDPAGAAALRWLGGYQDCAAVLRRFREDFPNPTKDLDGAAVRRWLLRWIARHPLCRFPSAAQWVRDLDPERPVPEQDAAGLLFWLVQDCRIHYLRQPPDDCEDVPLARVWLRHDATGVCRVRQIDHHPPFRQPLAPDPWPAPPGSVNPGRFLWQRWPDTCPHLAEAGIRATEAVPVRLPHTLDAMAELVERVPFVDCDERVTPRVLDAGDLGRRVIGFWGRPRDDLTELSNVGATRAWQLRELGITTFAEFAAADQDTLRRVFPGNVSDDAVSAMRRQAEELSDD